MIQLLKSKNFSTWLISFAWPTRLTSFTEFTSFTRSTDFASFAHVGANPLPCMTPSRNYEGEMAVRMKLRGCIHVFPGMGTSNSNKQKPCLVTQPNIIHSATQCSSGSAVHWEASGHHECVVSQIISHFSPLNITTWDMLHHPHYNIHHTFYLTGIN